MKKIIGLSVLFLFSSVASVANAAVPVGYYLAQDADSDSSSITLPSTNLTTTYLPIYGSASFNTTASRSSNQTETAQGSGGGPSGFALIIQNQSGQTVYLNLQGLNNSGAWGQSCAISDNALTEAGVDYVETCVGVGGVTNPSGVPINLYLAKQPFSDSVTFQSASHFVVCTLLAPNVTENNNIISLPQTVTYQLMLGTNGSCQVSTA